MGNTGRATSLLLILEFFSLLKKTKMKLPERKSSTSAFFSYCFLGANMRWKVDSSIQWSLLFLCFVVKICLGQDSSHLLRKVTFFFENVAGALPKVRIEPDCLGEKHTR
jgi:hypothetical protein